MKIIHLPIQFSSKRNPLCPWGKTPWYTLDGKLGGLIRWSALGGKEKNLHPCRESNTDSPVIQSLY
jgi:hypothetical protein